MPAYAPLDRNVGFHPRVSDAEARKREAVLSVAQHHLTAAEFTELKADLAGGTLDVRLYVDGIVLMRRF